MRKIYAVICVVLFSINAFSQILPDKTKFDPNRKNTDALICKWNNLQSDAQGLIQLKVSFKKGFSYLGVGFKTEQNQNILSNTSIEYQTKTIESNYIDKHQVEIAVTPDETPTKMYWSDIMFVQDNKAHQEALITIKTTPGKSFNEIRVDLVNMHSLELKKDLDTQTKSSVKSSNCPEFPNVIPRSTWLLPYYTQPAYSEWVISPTHLVVHHGASPDSYDDGDGAQVVRSYWDYHVNSNNWSDIGYNYLIDKEGNIYQGRQNPNMQGQDVRGAHAGNSNGASIGLNFLGNMDVLIATQVQLNAAHNFIAWWFNSRNLTIDESANIILQSGGTGNVPRLCGHRDVNIGGTTCPGNDLESRLPAMRTASQAVIDACNGASNLQITQYDCSADSFTFSWTGSGTGWYIAISEDPNYGSYYHKYVSGLSEYTGPTGFCDYPDCTQDFIPEPNITYYWKLWDGSNFTEGPSFVLDYCDVNPPATEIIYSGNWQTDDFILDFNDTDNDESGVAQSFYQVLDFTGNEWRANSSFGYFNDNFTAEIHSDWGIGEGTWSINAEHLNQTDETNPNTNIYASVVQNQDDVLLYTWSMNIGGTGTNLRAGIHFYSDDASQADRNNSYMVYFRCEGNDWSENTCEIFQYNENAMAGGTYLQEVPCTVLPNTWYNYALLFEPATGLLKVYQNNELITEYTFENPHAFDASGISLRTGNSNVLFDDLKVYKSRTTSELITVGPNKEVRHENPDINTPACKIKTVLLDSAENWSQLYDLELNIDTTAPTLTSVYDSLETDINQSYEGEELSACWEQAFEQSSEISSYSYCLGTAPGLDNAVSWANIGADTSVIYSGFSPIAGETYYTSVKATNGAGLESDMISSNGVTIIEQSVLVADFEYDNHLICEGNSINFTSTSIGAEEFSWFFEGGSPETSSSESVSVTYNNGGSYTVNLIVSNSNTSDTVEIENLIVVGQEFESTENHSICDGEEYIWHNQTLSTPGLYYDSLQTNLTACDSIYYLNLEVNPKPLADFEANDTAIFLPSAIATFVNNSQDADNYLWNFGDSGTSQDENPYHEYMQTGIYTVKLIASNSNCPDDTLVKDDYILVDDPTGVDYTNKNILITAYPNPFKDKVLIQFPENLSENNTLEVFDITGKCIISKQNITDDKVNLDLSGFEKGIYIGKLKSDNNNINYEIKLMLH